MLPVGHEQGLRLSEQVLTLQPQPRRTLRQDDLAHASRRRRGLELHTGVGADAAARLSQNVDPTQAFGDLVGVEVDSLEVPVGPEARARPE